MDSQYFDWMSCKSRERGIPAAAFTVLELLVSVTMIGLLIALLLPALMSAREASRRTSCLSHLREIGLAMHNYHGAHQQLPRSWKAAERDPTFVFGWMAQLLPEMEQTVVRRQLDFKERPNHLTLQANDTIVLPILLCPSDLTESSFELFEESDHEEEGGSTAAANSTENDTGSLLARLLALPTANYVGVFGTAEADDFGEFDDLHPEVYADGSVIHDRRIRFSDLPRGLSQTLLAGERTMATVPSTWLGVDLRGEDGPCRLVGSAMTRPNCHE